MSYKIKEKLFECPKCGSVDYCLTQKFTHSFIWVHCRQCNLALGLVNLKIIEENIHVSN